MISSKVISVSILKGFRLIKSVWGKTLAETNNLAVPYGFDCNPLLGERAVIANTKSNSDGIVVGFVSKNIIEDLKLGECGIYAKDPSGNVVGTLIIRNDGTIEMSSGESASQNIGSENEIVNIGGTGDNMVRYSVLRTAYNELQEKYNNLVDAFNTHTHPTAPTGPVSPPTSIPNLIPAEISTENIEGSKIENVRTNTGI